MATIQSRLTILFEDPFWIGLYERVEDETYAVSKITFGAEPKDYEVYEFLLHRIDALPFSPPVPADAAVSPPVNPKRRQRDIRRQLQARGVGTKAQQALARQREHSKREHTVQSREHKQEAMLRRYALRQDKKKAKHKGR